ncbi:hypothetical protein ABZ922_32310 [Streptomyces shenzhenensis]|uniref:hypothetical protein n=1 Tax=Streptomyces shenzhenensis TaxID=943815 RepID=UPI00340732DC
MVEADRRVLQAQHPSGDVRVPAHPFQVRVHGAHRHGKTTERAVRLLPLHPEPVVQERFALLAPPLPFDQGIHALAQGVLARGLVPEAAADLVGVEPHHLPERPVADLLGDERVTHLALGMQAAEPDAALLRNGAVALVLVLQRPRAAFDDPLGLAGVVHDRDLQRAAGPGDLNEPNPVLAQKRQHVLSGVGTGGRPLAPGELVQHHGAGRIDSVGSRVLQHLDQVRGAVDAQAPVDDQLDILTAGAGYSGHAAAPPWSAFGYK